MAFTISQAVAVSFNAVVNEERSPTNQWADSSAMMELEKAGIIERVDFSHTIEMTLDYRRNPGSGFQASELAPYSLTATDVLSAAQYTPAEVVTPVVWSRKADVTNPSKVQKVNFTAALLKNAVATHDDDFEQALFATNTNGFYGLPTIVPTTGQGTGVGLIDATVETVWRNPASTYLADGSDLDAKLTLVWNQAAKGSGSAYKPTLLLSGSEPHGLFEGQQMAQRIYDSQDIRAGAKTLIFKTARFAFSQYGGDEIYGLSSKTLKLLVSKGNFRDRSETQELQDRTGYRFYIYSAALLGTPAKSRLFVLDEA